MQFNKGVLMTAKSFFVNFGKYILVFLSYGIFLTFVAGSSFRFLRAGSSELMILPLFALLFALYAFGLWKWYRLGDWSLEAEDPRLSTWAWLPVLLLAAFMLIQTFLTFEASNNQLQLEEMMQRTPLFSFVYLVLVAPVLEELLLRGFLAKYFFPKQEKLWQTLLYLAVSAALFSRMHRPTTAVQFLIYFYMGIIFGLAYVTKKDLRYPIILHMINNLSVFLLP